MAASKESIPPLNPTVLLKNKHRSLASCIFCKIIKGFFKPAETGLSYAFLDIGPISKGHALVIPKDHTVKMHEPPDEYLADALPIAKKAALAQGLENYNILRNNERIAHQQVDHVHFHNPSMDDLKAYHTELVGKLEALGKL
ncbi:HIT-like protein [Boletus coccyginus]|nr:HIT-like protein [Boletus coccyginus]